MKNLLLILLSVAILLPSCKKDEDPIPDGLQYDGDNVSAPIFEVGLSEAAAYFPASFTENHIGKNLIDIEFYLLNLPASTELRVLEGASSTKPGNLIFSVDISGDVQANSWNRYVLANPIAITGEDLWITVRVTHNNPDERSVGCDAGPAKTNGDWIFSDTDNEWKTLRDRTNDFADINWNIRGNLSE